MKKIIIISLLLTSFNSFAQLNHFPVLIGYGKEKTIRYLDSLDDLNGLPHSYIEERSGTMDLVYDNDFGRINEDYYQCLSVTVTFKKIKGKNICIEEYISGTKGKSDSNSNYLQHEYMHTSDNNWIQRSRKKGIKTGACFFAISRRFFYSLDYSLIQ